MKNILIITNSEYKEWTANFKNTKKCCFEICIVDSEVSLKRKLNNYFKNNFWFDTVVLSPPHGHPKYPYIIWKPNASDNDFKNMSYTKEAIVWCLKITNRIHLSTCYQGKFISDFVKLTGLQYISGYNGWIRGTNQCEKFQHRYIQDGCPKENKYCHRKNPRTRFVYCYKKKVN